MAIKTPVNLISPRENFSTRSNDNSGEAIRQLSDFINNLRGEDWHLVGTRTGAAFEGTWKNFGGVYLGAGYRIDALGTVWLRGMVGAGTSGTVAFHLPAGYRPELAARFTCDADTASGSAIISADGSVTLYAASTAFFTLDNIAFRAV